MSLTPEERGVIETLVAAYHRFLALPQYHPSDQREFVIHLHAIQNMVMAREAVRTDADIFVNFSRQPEAPITPLPRVGICFPNFVDTGVVKCGVHEDQDFTESHFIAHNPHHMQAVEKLKKSDLAINHAASCDVTRGGRCSCGADKLEQAFS